VGFGPKIKQWKGRKRDTVFSLRGIPLGGYCAYYDEDADTLEKGDPRRFAAAPVWKRMIVVVAGSLMNILLAFVLAVGLHLGYGVIAAQPRVEAGCRAARGAGGHTARTLCAAGIRSYLRRAGSRPPRWTSRGGRNACPDRGRDGADLTLS
jgi:membrane-associated protease RseP (regulator of RpoE activity)